MKLKTKPMGAYETNCYILSIDNKDFIIDPGVGAVDWVSQNVKNPVAILNTHGHFDHVWSNKELKEKFNIPIYCPKKDAFMLENDPFNQGTPPSKADFKVKPNEIVEIEGVEFKFLHFPGHTPGCSVIEFENIWFSGDFLFYRSIGRWDFPYSNAKEMLSSLKRVSLMKEDKVIYPGHGQKTTLFSEQEFLDYWIGVVRASINESYF